VTGKMLLSSKLTARHLEAIVLHGRGYLPNIFYCIGFEGAADAARRALSVAGHRNSSDEAVG